MWPRPARRRLNAARALFLAAVVGLAVVAGMAVGRGISRPPRIGVAASGLPTPSETAASSSSIAQSPTATPSAGAPGPPLGLSGVTPPPGATPPPGIKFIGGLSFADLFSAARDLGLPCTSSSGAGADSAAGYSYFCQGTSANGQAQLTLSGSYWASDKVAVIHLTVLPEPIGATLADRSTRRAAAARLLTIPYQGADQAAARAWLEARLDDAGCAASPCETTIGAAQLSLQLGERGSRTFSLDGRTVAP